MKNLFSPEPRKLSCTLSIILCLLAFSPWLAAEEEQEEDTISLTQMIDEVKLALQIVEKDAAADELPRLESVTLELALSQVVDAKGKISFIIFSIGANESTEIVHSLKLTLKPPEEAPTGEISATVLGQLIASNILAGARAIDYAKTGLPVLHASNLTATLNFVAVTDKEGGIKVEFSKLGAELGGSISDKVTQKITISYKD
jgi:hypothetical protein